MFETGEQMMANTTSTSEAASEPMKIGEFAAVVGTDTPTIRFYEAEGVLPEPARTEAGYRVYVDADVDRLRFVKQARSIGLSLAEIRDIVVARDAGTPPCAYVRRLLVRQIDDTKQQIRDLKALLGELQRLEQLAAALPSEPVGEQRCICHAIECSALDDSASRRP